LQGGISIDVLVQAATVTSEEASLILSVVSLVVGLLLGLPALMMAGPPFFQWLYGAPNMKVSFGEHQEGIAKVLSVRVENQPIKNRLLRWLRIQTETEYIRAFANVLSSATGEPVGHRSGIDILPWHDGTFFPVIAHAVSESRDIVTSVEIQRGQARTSICSVTPVIPLPPGDYRLKGVILGSSPRSHQSIDKGFSVGITLNELRWVD
jgi:hypothetical protein